MEIAGIVLGMDVGPGDWVRPGDQIGLLESMKMEIPIITELQGQVETLLATTGEFIQVGRPVALLCHGAA